MSAGDATIGGVTETAARAARRLEARVAALSVAPKQVPFVLRTVVGLAVIGVGANVVGAAVVALLILAVNANATDHQLFVLLIGTVCSVAASVVVGSLAAIVLQLRLRASRALEGHARQPGPGHWDDAGFFARGIGVVTPHRAQRARVVASLLRAFPDVDPALVEGCVDTVERFQGGERHTVLISFGVGDPDVIRGEESFLLGLERTNVAISRAQAKCVVLMSEELAAHVPGDRKASAQAHALRGLVDEWPRHRLCAPVAAPGGGTLALTARWR